MSSGNERKEAVTQAGDAGDESLSPPPAPEIHRLIALSYSQSVLLVFLLAFPGMGVAGLFGDRYEVQNASSGTLRIVAETPTVTRYQSGFHISVRLRNTGSDAVTSVRVAFDSAYINRFRALSFLPSLNDAYVVRLDTIRGGAERLVRVELKGQAVGRHAGAILVLGSAGDSTSIPVRTLVLP